MIKVAFLEKRNTKLEKKKERKLKLIFSGKIIERKRKKQFDCGINCEDSVDKAVSSSSTNSSENTTKSEER